MEKYFILSFRGRLFSFSRTVFYLVKMNLLHFCLHEKSLCFVFGMVAVASRVGGKLSFFDRKQVVVLF
jgi:hypothetical protein